ncbi:hypothetical protein RE476_05370 [Methanolobus mangrovi]|uniref:Uncharacterized protein n=1 Tax=Methanolobus mangrovi TaxID=3072977 RepID=A0AA51UHJ4_9EURY|nr:hypothetical protein [Methanolobus mangrovi]WMW23260.1 hypothetical protein RE476_05370 [Methanolobus mangrovi]
MVKKQTLKNREFGYELSGVEHKLIFDSDETGFVRFDGRSRRIFYLDPSPFLPTPKRDVYIIADESVPTPNVNDLIKVTSFEIERVVKGTFDNLVNIDVRYVKAWTKIDPNKLLHRKVMDQEEYVNFFKHPFNRADENIDNISQCLAMCSVSSNAIGINEKGGIDSGIIAKKSGWDSFLSLQKLVPREFKSVKSPYFYSSSEVENKINPLGSMEVNLSILMPKETFVHVPIVFDAEMRPKSAYSADVSFEIPFVRAHLLDALMFQPEITQKAEKCLTERIYDMTETFTNSHNFVYKQDLGDAAPKLGSSIARMNFSNEVTVANVREGFDIWMDMFAHASKFQKSNLSPRDIFRLPAEAAQLYLQLEDNFGIDVVISMKDVETMSLLTPFELSNAIAALRGAGALYSPRIDFIKLLAFKI